MTFLFFSLNLQFEYDFRTTCYLAIVFTNLHIVLVTIILLVHIYGEVLTVEALGTVAHLHTMDSMATEDFKGELVEYMLYVLDTIEMAIVVNITIEWHEYTYGVCGGDTSTACTFDWAGLITAICSELAII